jgi:hypothetical protein
VVKEAKVLSEPAELVGFVEALGLEVERIGLEAGPLSSWLHDGLAGAGFEVVLLETRCLIPGFDGAVFSPAWRDALWVRFSTAAPARQRRSVARSNIVKRA